MIDIKSIHASHFKKPILFVLVVLNALSGSHWLFAANGIVSPPPVTVEFRRWNGTYHDTASLPRISTKSPGHGQTSNLAQGYIDDSGGWAYHNERGDPDFGRVIVNCMHKDRKGLYWLAQ